MNKGMHFWKAFRLLLVLAFFGLMAACGEQSKQLQEEEFSGPLLQADNVEILFSDSSIVRVRMQAQKQYEFENGDRQFPQGIYIEFLDLKGEISSVLDADTGYYMSEDNIYRAVGNVIVKDKSKDQRLETEELFWNPDTEDVYTDKFVTVIAEGDTLRGTGLEAKQDFSTWQILKPEGVIYDGGENEDE
jgi:LPS export ABC transporter protein LptC